MSDTHTVNIWPNVDGMDALAELALNLHWSWNHASDEIWRSLDSELWETTQNPWLILRTVSKEKIRSLLAAPDSRQRVQDLLRQNHESADTWFQQNHPDAALSSVAYFSMEFMLTEALPI
jgi:glycogen phosphorylase